MWRSLCANGYNYQHVGSRVVHLLGRIWYWRSIHCNKCHHPGIGGVPQTRHCDGRDQFDPSGANVGISALGAVLNFQLTTFFAERGLTDINPSNLYDSGSAASALPTELVATALNNSLDALFWMMLALSVVMVVATLLMPRIQLKATAPDAKLE